MENIWTRCAFQHSLHLKALFMTPETQPSAAHPLDTLRDIRAIMDRSARFISLSGWSGVWAGTCAVVGGVIAHNWLQEPATAALLRRDYQLVVVDSRLVMPFVWLGVGIFLIALAGAYFFTRRNAQRQGQQLWGPAARRVFVSMAVPIVAGAALALASLYYGVGMFVAPSCLLFYGVALVSAGKHTLTEIVYLGYAQILLGILNLMLPGYGLYFWAAGFGVLHIAYGLVMWRRHEAPGHVS
jgi:hypothetical protein